MTKIFILCLIFTISGCGYSKHQLRELNDSTFGDKRPDKAKVDIKDFIRPEETSEIIEQLAQQDFSRDDNKNTVLNILNYVQQLKQINDKKEYWQYPRETILKGGDCEDKTFLLLSMLMASGINGTVGVKGRYLGQGHMWVEYNDWILDPSLKTPKLIPKGKSIGYTPFFKFNRKDFYYLERSN